MLGILSYPIKVVFWLVLILPQISHPSNIDSIFPCSKCSNHYWHNPNVDVIICLCVCLLLSNYFIFQMQREVLVVFQFIIFLFLLPLVSQHNYIWDRVDLLCFQNRFPLVKTVIGLDRVFFSDVTFWFILFISKVEHTYHFNWFRKGTAQI